MSTKIVDQSHYFLLAKTLNELITRENKLTAASLARKLGIPTNKITRILNGDVTDPKASTLLQIANYFDITIEQLLGLESFNSSVAQSDKKPIPIFTMSAIGTQQMQTDWYHWSEDSIDSSDCYALLIDSDFYEPTFLENSLLIINPNLTPENRSYVIVKKKINSPHYSIKKVVTDGDQVYLYPIDPKLPVENYDEDLYTIAGVILEVHQKLHKKK